MNTSAAPSDPIAEIRHEWIEAAKTADAVKIVSFYCDDVVLMPPNETSLFGKDEALEWWQEYFQFFKMAVLSSTERDVQMIGDHAVEQWTYMVAIDPSAVEHAFGMMADHSLSGDAKRTETGRSLKPSGTASVPLVPAQADFSPA